MMRVLMALCATLIIASAVSAVAQAHPMRFPVKERYFKNRCGSRTVQAVLACEHRAAFHWGEKFRGGPGALYRWMKYISHRESRWDPFVTNASSGAAGLFQFMSRTWSASPYGRYSPYNPRWASLAAAWYASHPRKGGTHHWDL